MQPHPGRHRGRAGRVGRDRPVTDAAAGTGGVAVLDWADPASGPRWAGGSSSDAATWRARTAVGRARHRPRRAGPGRRADPSGRTTSPLDLQVEGPVALWSHRDRPRCSRPPRWSRPTDDQRVAAAGLAIAGLHVVVTPAPAGGLRRAGVARRLAGETPRPASSLPRSARSTLPWV